MNDAPHNLNRPNDAGLRDRLSALKDPTVMFGLICPVPGFLLLESSLGLVVYMALVLLALATKARNVNQQMRLPASPILGGLLIFLISDHPFAQSNWFLSGILPVLIAMIAIDWLDRHLPATHAESAQQTQSQGAGR